MCDPGRKKTNIRGKLLLGIFFLGLFLLPGVTKAQTSSDLLREYLFPIQYGTDVTQNDVIGLRIYKNLENQEPLTWYLNNVNNPKKSLPQIKVDGYNAVRDDRTIYIQAANLTDLTGTPTFWTNIYVLAYNQNASEETVNIFNQMLANFKFNKNIMDIYCLSSQYETVKDSLRRDTIRKSDFNKLKKIFGNSAGVNLTAGTYVPGMSISTWPSWQATLGQQLGTALPVDPLNVMVDNLIGCTQNSECTTGQCSGGYCSACPQGYDARTCWNERELKFYRVDGFVYKYQTQGGVLTIRYEYPQIIFPNISLITGKCFIGCNQGGAFYAQGSCLPDNRYCDTGTWKDNTCGDDTVRCNEVCDCDYHDLTDCNCNLTCAGDTCTGCLSCKDHYHAVGSLCQEDTQIVTVLTQTLSTAEKIRWTGDGWSQPYATACKANAILNNAGVCKCKINYHEEGGECFPDTRWFGCAPKPAVGAVWNSVDGYIQNWDGEKWVPGNSDPLSNYNETASATDCRFKCDTAYSWNDPDCTPDEKDFYCTGNPPNSDWFYLNGYTQVWNGTAWAPPDATAVYNATNQSDPANPDCRYRCNFNYTWDGDSCEPDQRPFACADKPASTEWTGASTYTQNWNGTSWLPEISTTYNETDTTACHFKCSSNFAWNGTACINMVVCGDGIITPNSTEVCDDGEANNGQFGYCNTSCTAIIGLGTPLFYDNFESLSFTNSNWQQGYCPTGCSWTKYFEYPLASNNHTFKSVNTTDGKNIGRDQYVITSGMENLSDVDVLMMTEYTSDCDDDSCYRDAEIIVRRTGGADYTTQSYYALLTNNGAKSNSPMAFFRVSNGNNGSGVLNQIGDASDPVVVAINTKYWLRVQVYNSGPNVVLRAMWWKVGDPMPSTWLLDRIDTDAAKITTGGSVGLAGWRLNTLYFDNFQVYSYTP